MLKNKKPERLMYNAGKCFLTLQFKIGEEWQK